MLGSIIAVIVFLFGAMVVIKRIQFIKQTSLTNIHGKCMAISFSSIQPMNPQNLTQNSTIHGHLTYLSFLWVINVTIKIIFEFSPLIRKTIHQELESNERNACRLHSIQSFMNLVESRWQLYIFFCISI